jgi:hypothetical protein
MCTLTLVHFVSIPNPYIWILIHVENTSSQGFCYNFACTGQLSNIKQFVLSNFVSSDRQIENDEVIRTFIETFDLKELYVIKTNILIQIIIISAF